MDKDQRKRLEELASSSVVGYDIRAALVEIDHLQTALNRAGRFYELAAKTNNNGNWPNNESEVFMLLGEAQKAINPLRLLVSDDIPADEVHFRDRAGKVIGKVINLVHEEPDSFQTAQGEPAEHAHNGDWLQPTVNPFGHGCCDCGLYHTVEWRLVDDDGGVINPVTISKDDTTLHLQLKFTRDEGETVRLRVHREKNSRDLHGTDIVDRLKWDSRYTRGHVPVTMDDAAKVITELRGELERYKRGAIAASVKALNRDKES